MKLTTLLLFTCCVAAGMPRAAAAQCPPRATAAGDNCVVATKDGATIRFVQRGQGPSILFIPGWTMTAEIWDPQLTHFSRAWRAVAIDPRGQGESARATEGLYPAARARDIKAVIDTLGLAPVVLVGWSMGVTEVASFVDQFGTSDLRAVVLVDGIAGAPYDPAVTPGMLKWLATFLQDREAQTAGFVKFMYRTPQSPEYLDRMVKASLKTPTTTAVALFVGTMAADNREALAKIDRPTLLAIAPGGPWDAQYADMQKRIPNSRLERFEGAGHALFVDQADKFNTVLDQFFAALP